MDSILDVELIAQSSYVYGLPDSTSISQEKALELVAIALQKEIGLQESPLNLYSKIPVYYDVTNAYKPIWRFLFNWGYRDRKKLESSTERTLAGFCFRVEMDAVTGELVGVEGFEFTHQMDDLAYQLKWY